MSTRICGTSAFASVDNADAALVLAPPGLGFGPGLFLRLLMLTAAPPSAEDWVIGPGASRLGRREAAVCAVAALAVAAAAAAVVAIAGLGIGSGGPGVNLWAGVDGRRVERLGSVVVADVGSWEWRVEWRDDGRERAGGVGSALGAMDVRRVEVAR